MMKINFLMRSMFPRVQTWDDIYSLLGTFLTKYNTYLSYIVNAMAAEVPGPVSIYRLCFPGMGIPMLKIRRLWDRLLFNMGIPMLVRQYLCIETATWWRKELDKIELILLEYPVLRIEDYGWLEYNQFAMVEIVAISLIFNLYHENAGYCIVFSLLLHFLHKVWKPTKSGIRTHFALCCILCG